MAHYRRRATPWVIAGTVIGLVYAIVIMNWYRSGDLGLVMDARLEDVNICLTETEYTPVRQIPINTQLIYLCGVVEGTTNLQGGLLVYHEDAVICDAPIRLRPGVFYLPLCLKGELAPGRYRVDIGRERQILGEVEFTAVE